MKSIEGLSTSPIFRPGAVPAFDAIPVQGLARRAGNGSAFLAAVQGRPGGAVRSLAPIVAAAFGADANQRFVESALYSVTFCTSP